MAATKPADPVCLLLCNHCPAAIPQEEEIPVALEGADGISFADAWWDAIVVAGNAKPEDVYVLADAESCKPLERWGLGRGLDVASIINTGGTGRWGGFVTLADVSHALAAIERMRPGSAARPVLVVAASKRPHPAAAAEAREVVAAGLASTGGSVVTGTLLSLPASQPYLAVLMDESSSATDVVWGPAGDWAPMINHEAATASAHFGGWISLMQPASTAALAAVADAALDDAGWPLAAADGSAVADAAAAAPGSAGWSVGAGSYACAHSPAPAWVGIASANGLTVAAVGGAVFAPDPAGTRTPGTEAAPTGSALAVGQLDGASPVCVSAAVRAAGTPPSAAAPAWLPFNAVRSAQPPAALPAEQVVRAEAFARVGLMGNPSDGFFGRTVAVTVSNFKAVVTVWPDETPAGVRGRVTLAPHPVYDPTVFDNCAQLEAVAVREGYSGGVRLLMACLQRLHRLLRDTGVASELPASFGRGFVAKWHTTVPRQVGLAGSSAILTAFTRAMLGFWGLGERPDLLAKAGLTLELVPSFVLAVETEALGINAGLQDRVAQWWEGAVAMDFARDKVEATGGGTYTRLEVGALPALFLAWAPDPSDSGRIHAPVRQRWLDGEEEVVEGMRAIADCARQAAELLSAGAGSDAGSLVRRGSELASLMTRNFEGRRSLFGDAALGAKNLRMVSIARSVGACGKFPGSGGAVLGVVDVAGMARAGALPEEALPAAGAGVEAYERACGAGVEVLRRAFAAEGFVCVRLRPTAGKGGGV